MEKQGGTVTALYLHGLRGPEYRKDSGGNVRWYLYDGLGSVLGEVDPSGSVTGTRKLDVYGAVRGTTGTLASKHGFCGGLGHPSEDDTGLVYMRARWMDPVTGRFESEDSNRDGENWFCYAADNPVCAIDADGNKTNWNAIWWCASSRFADCLGVAFAMGGIGAFCMKQYAVAAEAAALAVMSFAFSLIGLNQVGYNPSLAAQLGQWLFSGLGGGAAASAFVLIGMAAESTQKAAGLAAIAVIACAVYGIMCISANASIGWESIIGSG
jgi:RHS repeat-associated protein